MLLVGGGRVKLLNNLEINFALLKHGVPVDSEPDKESLLVIPVGTVIRQRGFLGVTLMLCGTRGWQAPTHPNSAVPKGDIVDIIDLEKCQSKV